MMFDDMIRQYNLGISEQDATFIKALIAGDKKRCACVFLRAASLLILIACCANLQRHPREAVLVRDRREQAQRHRRGQVGTPTPTLTRLSTDPSSHTGSTTSRATPTPSASGATSLSAGPSRRARVSTRRSSHLYRLIDSSRVVDNEICFDIKDANQVYELCYTRVCGPLLVRVRVELTRAGTV